MRRLAAGVVAVLVAGACGDDADRPPASANVPASDAGDAAAADAAVAADGASSAGTWSPRAPLPSAIQEVAVVAVGDAIYALGGLVASGQPTASVAVYRPASDAWSVAAPLPEPLHHVNAAVVDGKIWVVGALRGGSFAAAGITLVYDPAANAWTPKPSMLAGTERGASMVAAIDKTIYVAGGLRGGASVADFSAFDTATGAWTTLPAMDAARDHGMGAAIGQRFFAIGGRASGISSHFARVDAFDPATQAWTPRAPMPTSRAGAAAAVAKGLVVVAGGEGNAASANGVFANVEAYDPARDAWLILAAMRTPRHGTGGATIGDVVYVPGGGDVQALGATAVVEALTF